MNARMNELAEAYGNSLFKIAGDIPNYNTVIECARSFKNAIFKSIDAQTSYSTHLRNATFNMVDNVKSIDDDFTTKLDGTSMFFSNYGSNLTIYNAGRLLYMRILEHMIKSGYKAVCMYDGDNSIELVSNTLSVKRDVAIIIGSKAIYQGHFKTGLSFTNRPKGHDTIIELNVEDLVNLTLNGKCISITFDINVLKSLVSIITDVRFINKDFDFKLTNVANIIDCMYKHIYGAVFNTLYKDQIYSNMDTYEKRKEESGQFELFINQSHGSN